MFYSGFFDAILTDGKYDRVYSAEDYAKYFSALVANGVFANPATSLQIIANTPNAMSVLVSPGMGWINGYYCSNDASYVLLIEAASGSLARIDTIVLRWDSSTREIKPYVKKGTASAFPVVPSLTRTSALYEIQLAEVAIAAGATNIAQPAITDTRSNATLCGWVKGTIDQIDATNLFAQYDSAFSVWFKDIQAQLSGDVAANLQRQITDLQQKQGFTRTETLTPETCTALGIPTTSVPDKAINLLSSAVSPLQYVWNKYSYVYEINTDVGHQINLDTTLDYPSKATVTTYNSITLNSDGSITVSGQSNVTLLGSMDGASVTNANALNNLYFYKGSVLYKGTNQTVLSNNVISAIADIITSKIVKTFLVQISSYTANTYPQDGIQGGYYYKYMGRPSAMPIIVEVGSYIGTGTYGSSNQNILSFRVTPKLVIVLFERGWLLIHPMLTTVRSFQDSSSQFSVVEVTFSPGVVSWYSSEAYRQMNTLNTKYTYFAIG